jgi:cytochrome b
MHANTLPATATATATPSTPPQTRRMVDAPTRVFHWLFALSFVGAYLTADGESWRMLHVTLGYTMAGLLAFRVVYGVWGPPQARLALMLRRLKAGPEWVMATAAQLSHRFSGQSVDPSGGNPAAISWRQGQNLLLPLAVVAMLVLVVPLTVTGYVTFNDWGDALGGDWLEELHGLVGDALLAVVLGHVALIAGLSLLRKKNLAQPMLSGRAQGAGPDLAKRNHAWLAALVVVAVLAFWAWQWQQSPNGLLWGNAQGGAAFSRQNAGDDD